MVIFDFLKLQWLFYVCYCVHRGELDMSCYVIFILYMPLWLNMTVICGVHLSADTAAGLCVWQATCRWSTWQTLAVHIHRNITMTIGIWIHFEMGDKSLKMYKSTKYISWARFYPPHEQRKQKIFHLSDLHNKITPSSLHKRVNTVRNIHILVECIGIATLNLLC